MHFSQASWLLAASMGAIVNAVSVVEVDLVFPRNETYSPTQAYPFVFAVQNSEKAQLLNLRVSYRMNNWDNSSDTFHPITPYVYLERANLSSSDPYLSYRFFSGLNPGHWWLTWEVEYQSCNVDAERSSDGLIHNSYSWSRMFTIANSTSTPDREVDLVAATANDSCPGDMNAVAINVTDTTMQTIKSINWTGRDTCVVTTNSTSGNPVHTPNPCGVSISPEVAASISANFTAQKCSEPNPPNYVDCSAADKSAAQKLIILAVSGLLAMFGAFAFTIVQSW
ncbi:hypothetical protein BJX63DRAFT_380758 [Aspergillus granulosus]|uniref:DUF7136 domain-containing protein n=1 Tax=Aspergillus granulosus TaxID=176169 RepID=A0ABR4I0L0_9EURO